MLSVFSFSSLNMYPIVFGLNLVWDGAAMVIMLEHTVNFLGWNVRGLNDQDRKDTVHETVAASSCHIVCLQETKLASITPFCQASCISQGNQKSELMEMASIIHLYTSTPPLTCDGRIESQHVDTDRRRESQHVDTNGKRESQHVDTKGGNNNFTINCENQDSNSRP
jgi:hypothetical protein